MRFEVRWSNGLWKLFDTHNYTDVEVYGRQVDALAAASWANSRAVVDKAARKGRA